MKKKIFILLFFTHIFLSINFLYSKSIFVTTIGLTELELEFDAYYMPLDLYIPFTSEKSIPKLILKKENIIYKHLIKNFFSPKFLVLEASTYPLPLFGILSKKYTPEFYNSAKISKNFNLIESITTSGFKEPWAFSIFIGNVIKFARQNFGDKTQNKKQKIDYDGRGYSGLLLSYGNYHIKNNELIKTHWLETELKIKGSKSNKNQKMYLSYKIGSRIFFTKDIKSTIYIGLVRNRIDYNFFNFSFIKNSYNEIRVDFNIENADFIKLLLLIGKNFPLKNSKIVFELKIGILWEGSSMYTGELKDTNDNKNISIIIRPNIKF